MWSSSGGPALPCRRHDTLPAAPDWDSLLPLLPESVRLLRLVKTMPPCMRSCAAAAA